MSTMSLRKLNEILREEEIEYCAQAKDRLVLVLAILRSLHQGEISTNDGICNSLEIFQMYYGPITTESVDLLMELPNSLLDKPLNFEYIEQILEAE